MSSSSPKTAEWELDMLSGFRFHPTDELMVKLLKKKMEGCLLGPQDSHFMRETDSELAGNQYISLFRSFLKAVMQGKNPPQAGHTIPEIDVLKFEPWDLPGHLFPDSPFQPKEWFAFSRPVYINNSGSRKRARNNSGSLKRARNNSGSLKRARNNSRSRKRSTKQGSWKPTGDPREIKSQQQSKWVTFEKRTLTFHIGRGKKAKGTGWVMHEYSPIRTEQGSDPNQQTDFVLYRLKYKSNKKKSKDDSICVKEADPCTGGCIDPSYEDDQADENHMTPEAEARLPYEELEHVGVGSSNEEDDEPGGRVSSDFNDQAVDDVVQEKGEYSNEPFPAPEPPRKHQPPQLGSVPDELVDPGTGRCIASCSDNQAAPIYHMIPNQEKLQAYKEREHVPLRSGNHDGGERSGFVSSDMIRERDIVLCHLKKNSGKKDTKICDESELGNDNVSNCEDLSVPVMTPKSQDYRSSTLQSPTYIELRDVLQANGIYDDCNEMQSPFGDKNSSVTEKNDISTCDEGQPHGCTMFEFANKTANDMFRELRAQPEKNLDPIQLHATQQSVQSPTYAELDDLMDIDVSTDGCLKWPPAAGDHYSATYKNNMILEACPQAEENLALLFHAPQMEDYSLQPLTNGTSGRCFHDNNYIGCTEFHSQIWR